MSAETTIDVALLALPESSPAALYGLHELLGAVGATWGPLTGEPEAAARRFRPLLVSRDGAPLRSAAGPLITLDASIRDAPMPAIAIVTDLALAPDSDPRGRWGEEIAWVRRLHARGAVICSVCSGAVFLAESGLLDGVEATTHWSVVPLLRDRYPSVRLQPARILCPAGPEHRVVTAGGASSWADLGLYLVARFSGPTEARRMARVFVIGDRSDGQLPFAAMARPRQHDDAAIAEAQRWIADNYTLAQPVARMAAAAGMPERSFSRRFRSATGYAPVAYVQALRIEEAKQMLETTDAPVDAIARGVGYADPVFFRRVFKRSVGVTAARYRRRFATLPRSPRR